MRRNLKEYPFTAAMTKEERVKVRDKIIYACKKFVGNLKTRCFKLDGGDKQKKPDYIDSAIKNMCQNGYG